MNAAAVEQITMIVGITGLIGLMFFIIYDLGKRAKAGKFGLFILFLGLGVGVLGYVIKVVLTAVLDIYLDYTLRLKTTYFQVVISIVNAFS